METLDPELGMVPGDFLSETIGHISEVVGFRKWTAVIEGAGGRVTGFAGVNPFLMMTDAFGNERIRPFEILELFLGQEGMLAVIGQEHPFASDKKHAGIPFRNFSFFPGGWLF